jgi:hypothetical protein
MPLYDHLFADGRLFMVADLPRFKNIADALAASIAGCNRVVIQEAGHMSNMENVNDVNDALLSFLAVASGRRRFLLYYVLLLMRCVELTSSFKVEQITSLIGVRAKRQQVLGEMFRRYRLLIV